MEILVATAKVPKFGLSESGDSLEVLERPRGGLTAVMADGQGHGRPAKRVSKLVVDKAVSLVADGARDGAVARAVHDFLFAIREGKVSADLTILSVDLRSRSFVVSRNSNAPVLVRKPDGVLVLDQRVEPIGVHEMMKPSMTEWALEPGTVVVALTDGVIEAGRRRGQGLSAGDLLEVCKPYDVYQVDRMAEGVLGRALDAEAGQPQDDMTVTVFGISARRPEPAIRRLSISFPV